MERQERSHVSLLFIIVLLQACSWNRGQVLPGLNTLTADVYRQNDRLMRSGKPFTGTLYTLQPNSTDTAEVMRFDQGLEHGTWRKWYPDGRPMESREFTRGLKTGLLLSWWPNGRRRFEYRFENGEYQGTCREWSDRGILIKEMNYEQGHEAGRQRQFYADGTVKANYIIANGRRYGLLGTKNCVNVADSIPFY